MEYAMDDDQPSPDDTLPDEQYFETIVEMDSLVLDEITGPEHRVSHLARFRKLFDPGPND